MSLNAMTVGKVAVADFDTRTFIFDTYSLNLRLNDHLFEEVEVIASEGDIALLELDILNHLNIDLNGHRKRLILL